jgi:hypothetical protein
MREAAQGYNEFLCDEFRYGDLEHPISVGAVDTPERAGLDERVRKIRQGMSMVARQRVTRHRLRLLFNFRRLEG